MAQNPNFRPRTPLEFLIRPFIPRKHPIETPNTQYNTDPAVFWKISRAWLPHVIGSLEALTQPDAWQGTPEQIFDTIQEAEKLMIQEITMSNGLIFDLRQLGILLERQNEQNGAWSTLYDPTAFVILKSPPTPTHNIINAAFGRRGLGINQAGGNFGLTIAMQGIAGQAAYLATDNIANTNTTLGLYRAEENGDLMRVAIGALPERTVINRYAQLTLRRYEEFLPIANASTLGAIISLDDSIDPTNYPDGVYLGRFDGAGYVWQPLRFFGGNDVTGLFINQWYSGIAISENTLSFPKQQFIDIEEIDINPVASGQPFAARWRTPPVARGLDPEQYIQLQIDIPAPEPQVEVLDWIRGGGVVLPENGDSKVFRITCLGDSGVIVPFVVPAGYTLEGIAGYGLWEAFDPFFGGSGDSYICDLDGVTFDGDLNGQLLYGIKPVGNTAFLMSGYSLTPYEFTADSHLKFDMKRADNTIGRGYLAVEFTLSAPLPPAEYIALAGALINAQIISVSRVGLTRWRVVAAQTTIDEDSWGLFSVFCQAANPPTTPERCFNASNVVLSLWQPAPGHNFAEICGSGGVIVIDTADEGAAFIENFATPMAGFYIRFSDTTCIVEFDLEGLPSGV
jgi:hypothetical protein